jgi:hypothetical protein
LYRVLNSTDTELAKRTNERFNASQLKYIGSSGLYLKRREVTQRFRLPPGNYLIIPSCDNAGASGQFLLRVFTEVPIGRSNATILANKSNKRTIEESESENALNSLSDYELISLYVRYKKTELENVQKRMRLNDETIQTNATIQTNNVNQTKEKSVWDFILILFLIFVLYFFILVR